MDLRQLVIFALQVSILATVFGFGLKATPDDLLYVLRRPGLLARSLLAVFVIMPIVAVMLNSMFSFSQVVEIELLAFAISPVPPLLPSRETKAGGHASYGLGLMAILAAISIVAVPAAVAVLGWYLGRPLAAPASIAGLVLKVTLLPLAAGMIVRAYSPAWASRLEMVVTRVAKILLPLAVLLLLIATASAIWRVLTSGTVFAFTLFVVIGLVVGHVLGGPDPDNSIVLALSTACRHPAIAMSIAAANFPNLQFGATILVYLLVNVVIGVFYVAWLERYAARMVHAG